MDSIELQKGKTPLLISVPHAGTMIPPEVKDRMQPEALFLPDTDWFVDKLYGWAQVEGAGLITTPWSRYLIDLNRPPDDQPLYSRPGTSLVPLKTFCGHPVYQDGRAPDAAEVEQRLAKYWKPYHELLGQELEAIRARHGHAVLLDAHSIRSEVPELFDGELPNLNLGSNSGSSADPDLVEMAWDALASREFTAVRDARFKGGYITRHYGQPHRGVHALQLEIAQRSYMQEFPVEWDLTRARSLVTLLKAFVSTLENWQPEPSENID